MRVVLLNGPPRSGKDTAANALLGFSRARKWGFSYHLKEATHASYGLFRPDGTVFPHDAFEAVKDEPRAEFCGLSPRMAYIKHSEDYMKPIHGKEIFGQFFLRRIMPMGGLIIAPDSGFADEAMPTIRALGPDRVMLIRVHRPGRTFAGDSRSYVELPVMSADVDNDLDGDPNPFLARVAVLVAAFAG